MTNGDNLNPTGEKSFLPQNKDFLADLEAEPAKPAVERTLESPEASWEQLLETPAEQSTETAPIAKELKPEPVKTAPAATVAPAPLNVLLRSVEGILQEDLSEVYGKMSPEKQQEFKQVGEETVSKITKLLQAAKVKVREIFSLIFKWLSLIPGVNKFFLEQEAKIKTDQVLALKKRLDK